MELKASGSLDGIIQALDNLSKLDRKKLNSDIAEEMLFWTLDTIEYEKRNPDTGELWQDWSPDYQARGRTGEGILVRSGDLRDELVASADAFDAVVGSYLDYASAHQEPVNTLYPRRSFLGMTDEMIDAIQEIVEDAIMGAFV